VPNATRPYLEPDLGIVKESGPQSLAGVKKGTDEDAEAERFGIFIGLWAPTFFILSNRFERYADRAEAENPSKS
jgi:hypothetical protein